MLVLYFMADGVVWQCLRLRVENLVNLGISKSSFARPTIYTDVDELHATDSPVTHNSCKLVKHVKLPDPS